jgi:hypothetical protein
MATTAAEHSKTRADLAQLAGRGPISLISTLAGVLVGFAMFGLLLGGAVAILRGNESQLDLSESWGSLSARGGLLLGGLLLVSYLLAGYMAGRMAWRRGAAHGVVVFLGSIFGIALAALLVRTLTQPEDVEGIADALRSFGVPVTQEEWGNVGLVVWVASLGGMLLGSVLGGLLGERWFTKVSRRALAAEIDVRDRMTATNKTGNGNGIGNGNGHRAEAAGRNGDFGDLSKEELYQRAQKEDIPGRSHMSKDELKDALQKQG